jgi:murein DD-endopeptidase MepM/ murein hydrolase activator NlpD
MKPYHLGEDVPRNAGTPVYAPANGVVKHAQERDGYGAVVIIECKVPPLDADRPAETVQVVIGHLRIYDLKAYKDKSVTKGELIGYLGTREQNGGWGPHVHFGIHKGAYAGDWTPACSGPGWVYSGYGPVCERDSWYVPTAFILSHGGSSCQ